MHTIYSIPVIQCGEKFERKQNDNEPGGWRHVQSFNPPPLILPACLPTIFATIGSSGSDTLPGQMKLVSVQSI